MKFFTLTIVLSIFSLGAVADSIFETVALNSEYLVADTQTEVKLLGSLSNGYRIYNYRNYFNNGNRATTRIVAINSKSELVGLYGINDWAIKLTGDCIIFPYSKEK